MTNGMRHDSDEGEGEGVQLQLFRPAIVITKPADRTCPQTKLLPTDLYIHHTQRIPTSSSLDYSNQSIPYVRVGNQHALQITLLALQQFHPSEQALPTARPESRTQNPHRTALHSEPVQQVPPTIQ